MFYYSRKDFTTNGNPYRMKNLGEALAWEYFKRIGIDGVKPDVHFKRFFSSSRMGTGHAKEATNEEVLNR